MHCLGARASPCAHPRPGSAVRRAALRASPLRRSTVVFCKSEDADGDQPAIIKQAWQGSDQFSSLGDRKDEPPLPLPPIKRARTIYLVRHGQSTWNAEERIQGSSDLSVLTAKGVTQAQTTRRLLSSLSFDRLVYSPLARAAQTAEIIWEGRSGPKSMLPQLREIDLYEFQGLLKSQGKALFGDEYAKWQSAPSEFELKGRAPVRELWYRASLAWQSLLDPPAETTSTLVVAHNAVNQALICTALGLPASYFRTINQSNAAVTTIVLQPSSPRGDSPTAILQSLNASPNRPFKENEDPISRMVLVPAVSGTGAAIAATASFLQGLPMQHVLCAGGGPAESAAAVLSSMHELEGANGGGERSSSSNSSSGDESDTNSVVSVSSSSSAGSNGASPPCSVVMMEEAFRAGTAEEQGRQLFKQARGLLETSPQSTIAVVATPSALAALVCCALGLSPFASASRFRLDPCSVSLVQYPKGPLKRVEIKCLNYTAHLSNA